MRPRRYSFATIRLQSRTKNSNCQRFEVDMILYKLCLCPPKSSCFMCLFVLQYFYSTKLISLLTNLAEKFCSGDFYCWQRSYGLCFFLFILSDGRFCKALLVMMQNIVCSEFKILLAGLAMIVLFHVIRVPCSDWFVFVFQDTPIPKPLVDLHTTLRIIKRFTLSTLGDLQFLHCIHT